MHLAQVEQVLILHEACHR